MVAHRGNVPALPGGLLNPLAGGAAAIKEMDFAIRKWTVVAKLEVLAVESPRATPEHPSP